MVLSEVPRGEKCFQMFIYLSASRHTYYSSQKASYFIYTEIIQYRDFKLSSYSVEITQFEINSVKRNTFNLGEIVEKKLCLQRGYSNAID